MSSSNLIPTQIEEDYRFGPLWIRKSFLSDIGMLKNKFSVSVSVIFDFIPYILQEVEPAVGWEASLGAVGSPSGISQHYRQFPQQDSTSFVLPGLTSDCSRNRDVCSTLPSLAHQERTGFVPGPEPLCNLGNWEANPPFQLAGGVSYPLLKRRARACPGPAKRHHCSRATGTQPPALWKRTRVPKPCRGPEV